ncbi:MAG: amidohydrolase family protein, partial [Clostridia bacterium]|nr:amidohydrolase family protein [Clostridia bacterium]
MILIKNVTILTMDRENPVIKDGFVLTEGNKIKYVGETRPEFEGYEIDGKGKILMPGFVNAHTHVPMTLLRSYADGYELETWLFDKIFPVEDRLTADHIYWGTLLGIAEMIKSGTTSFSEMYYELDAI